jgi:hypothetical protein
MDNQKLAKLLTDAAVALQRGNEKEAKSTVRDVFAALCTSTPNGFDERWIDCINEVLGGRESDIQIKDLEPLLYDRFIGPMCDALEDTCIECGNDIVGDDFDIDPKTGIHYCSRRCVNFAQARGA